MYQSDQERADRRLLYNVIAARQTIGSPRIDEIRNECELTGDRFTGAYEWLREQGVLREIESIENGVPCCRVCRVGGSWQIGRLNK